MKSAVTVSLGAGLLLALLPACASILSKDTYAVSFDTTPSGADVTIRDGGGTIVHREQAPFSVTLEASDGFFSSADYTVQAHFDGYREGAASLSAGLDGWYFGNILLGGFIGMIIVDPLTGAMWRLDDSVNIQLEPLPSPPRDKVALAKERRGAGLSEAEDAGATGP